MAKFCEKCGEELGFTSWKIRKAMAEEIKKYGVGNRLCNKCFSELRAEWLENNPPEWLKKHQQHYSRKNNIKHYTLIKILALSSGMISLLIMYFNVEFFLSLPVIPYIVLYLTPAFILNLFWLYLEIKKVISNKKNRFMILKSKLFYLYLYLWYLF